ncbi:MAG: fructosamine kinase family protein [Bacteroidetes bacterium]|nr:fructosamine kinase family protein [Bacteroidota bacterium]
MIEPNEFYKSVVANQLGSEVNLYTAEPVSGGCINNGVKLSTSDGFYFLKWNTYVGDMFEKEEKGLGILQNPKILTIPKTIGYGTIDSKDFLLMEFINRGRMTADYWTDFGHKLASLHRCNQEKFGLDHDNYIGSLPQSNRLSSSWVEFFIDQRLRVQLTLAMSSNKIPSQLLPLFDTLIQKIPDLLPEEKPALLHGDLWSGNVMVGSDGKVCLIDPAVYYGHREIELAFTNLFGGFDRTFYEAYNEEFPLVQGYENRFDIYNLYPLLVHVNLFGSSYLSGIQTALKKFT